MNERAEMDTLMGGREVGLLKKDGNVETVKVLQLEIEQYPKLLTVQENEREQVALYCGRDVEWAKTLSPASHELVMATGEELNRDFFVPWVQRRLAKMEMLRPGLLDGLVRGLAPGQGAAASGSVDSSQKLPSSAGSHSPRPGSTASPS